MKKIFLLIMVFILISVSATYAAESNLLDVRNKFFETSRGIKPLLLGSKDVILLSSMWDACIVTITQLDAYFSMQGLFNTINNKDINEVSIDYLVNWLKVTKETNSANIKSLKEMSYLIEEKSKGHVENLQANFNELGLLLDKELAKLTTLKQALKK